MALRTNINKRGPVTRFTRSAPQLLTGAGALSHTNVTTLVTTTGAANALTLADGNASMVGFLKCVVHHVKGASGTAVLTAGASLHLGASIATITLTNVRDSVELEWDGTNWNVVAYTGATFT